jgi:N-methylhydantoinase A
VARTVIGCDVGGTFTDFFVLEETGVRALKLPSTAAAPEEAVLAGLAELLSAASDATLVHGSTVATNTVLERKGARTGLVTTQGFRDVIEIGRQARLKIYELEPRRPPPLVPRELRFEVDERVLATGTIERALSPGAAAELVERLCDAGVESVAVCLLFSFLEPAHERLLASACRERGLPVSASHEVLPQYREYERTSTTVMNAYVAPVMSRYLTRLDKRVKELGVGTLGVMTSAGGVASAERASARAAETVLSGPAGGVAGAFQVASAAGFDRIITFDMGGTSTDVALCDGAIPLQGEASVDGLPVSLPAVDVHTIGAGGGSLAWLDAGGALQAGPQSAGAMPGPAAYGRGGKATVTDANVALGRLPASLASGLKLDHAAATAALADVLPKMAPEAAALQVLQVVEARMERALRAVSLERGYDPADFTLVPFGGAGPLHACALAESLGVRRVLVPRQPGILSAIGMAVAPERREYSVSVLRRLERGDALLEASGKLEAMARSVAGTRGWQADLRFAGQAHELRVAVEAPSAQACESALREAHLQRYGFLPEGPAEIVSLRLVATTAPRALPAPSPEPDRPRQRGEVEVVLPAGARWCPLIEREALQIGEAVHGPALIVQYDSTTLLAPGWAATVDGDLNLVLEPI